MIALIIDAKKRASAKVTDCNLSNLKRNNKPHKVMSSQAELNIMTQSRTIKFSSK